MKTAIVFVALVLLASAVSGRKLAQNQNPSLGNVVGNAAGRVTGAVVGGVLDTLTGGSGSSSNNNNNNNNNNQQRSSNNQGNNNQGNNWSSNNNNNNQGNNQQWNQGNNQGNNQGTVYRTYTRPTQVQPNSDALLAWRDYTSKCTGSRFNPSNTAAGTCATLSGRLCSRSDVRCGQERGTTLFLDNFGNIIARGNDDSGNLSS